MGFRRRRWCARILCGAVLFPLIPWLLVTLVAPTGWARRRIVAQLESRSGRRVGLERLSVGLTGAIHLTNLEIGSPQGTDDPWLKAADIRLDLGLLGMLRGHYRPTHLEADGVELRVLRRSDGSIELADLIRPEPPAAAADPSRPTEGRISVRVRRASVAVVDEPTRTRIRIEDVAGEGYAEGRMAIVERIRGSVNGGEIQFAARVDRTESNLSAEAQLRADDVGLDEGMNILRYIVPVLAGTPSAVKGRLNADISVHGRGPDWPALCRDLSGHGVLALNRVGLDGAPAIAELARFVDLGGSRRIGSIRTDFVYKDRRVTTDHLTFGVGRMPITMSGWTDLDGKVDYQMKIDRLNERLPSEARRILGDLKLDVASLTTLTLRGTVNRPVLEANGVPIDSGLVRDRRLRPDDRQKLRLLGRQLRDQFLR